MPIEGNSRLSGRTMENSASGQHFGWGINLLAVFPCLTSDSTSLPECNADANGAVAQAAAAEGVRERLLPSQERRLGEEGRATGLSVARPRWRWAAAQMVGEASLRPSSRTLVPGGPPRRSGSSGCWSVWTGSCVLCARAHCSGSRRRPLRRFLRPLGSPG